MESLPVAAQAAAPEGLESGAQERPYCLPFHQNVLTGQANTACPITNRVPIATLANFL